MGQPCPINGEFSAWDAWTGCSADCGGGTKSRSRSCNSPAPQHGGADCVGSSQESATCNVHACPAHRETAGDIDGGGNAVYLDRHHVRCEAGEVLTSFKLLRPTDTTINYNYQCAATSGGSGWVEKTTPQDEIDDDGNMVYLDRHHVRCPNAFALSCFRLVRDGDANIGNQANVK